MPALMKKNLKLVIYISCLSFVPGAGALAESTVKQVAADESGIAILGYDTVAYFTEEAALLGNPEFTHSWQGVQWYFANARHRDMFAENPDRFAPQFGGFCSNGLSKGKTVVADPEQWTIVEGKLYIKFNLNARDKWRQDKNSKIKKAKKNWDIYLRGEPLVVVDE